MTINLGVKQFVQLLVAKVEHVCRKPRLATRPQRVNSDGFERTVLNSVFCTFACCYVTESPQKVCPRLYDTVS